MCDLIDAGLGDKPCINNIAGVRRFYLWNYVADPFTVVDGVATGVNANIVPYEFKLIGDDHTLTAPVIGDFKVGNKTGVETFTTVLKGVNEASNTVLNKANGAYMSGCVIGKNGKAIAIGVFEGFNNITIDLNTGGAGTDVNGYNCIFVAESTEIPPILDAETLTALEALVPAP